jgi:DNA-binding transcriptional regulator YdaS (Cro superfamily)
MRDLPILKLDDRAKAIVVSRARRKDRPVEFVFDDHDTVVVRPVDNQLVCRPKFDGTDDENAQLEYGAEPAQFAELVSDLIYAVDRVGQRKFAAGAGVSRQTVNALMSSGRRSVSRKVAAKIHSAIAELKMANGRQNDSDGGHLDAGSSAQAAISGEK